MTVSRRLVGNAIAARVATLTPSTIGYYGQIGRALPGLADTTPADPPVKSSTDPRVVPYFILYPSLGGDGPDKALCSTSPDGRTHTFRITAAAGDVEDLLALVDRLDVRLLGWVPTISGAPFPGPIVQLPGYEPPLLTDQTVTPARPYALLQYQITL